MLFKQLNHINSQQRFESEAHNFYAEEINKIALSSNDVRDSKILIELYHILMVQMLEKYARTC